MDQSFVESFSTTIRENQQEKDYNLQAGMRVEERD